MYRHNDVRDNVTFSIEIMSTLKTIKSSLNWSYDKQNLTAVFCPFTRTQTQTSLLREWLEDE